MILIIYKKIGSIFSTHKEILFSSLIPFLILIVFAILIIDTGIGVSLPADYWYGAGVPVLWIQVVASVFFGIIISRTIDKTIQIKININLLIFILIWIVAAYFWGNEPLRSSFFMTDTGSNPILPYSDSATFDIGSQYALIGQGLFNGQYFDRSLYPAFLAYLHIIAGQKIEHIMMLQACIFSVFPALAFLLGKELFGRGVGLSIAILLLFRGINSIAASSYIDLAGPKMMLTDFPSAIGVLIIVLFVLKWLKNPNANSNIIFAGGAIGFTILLRTNVILLVPFIVLYFVLHFKSKKKYWICGSLLLVLGMLISTLPTDIQNQKKGVPIYYLYYSRFQNVLRERYGISYDSHLSIFPQVHNSYAVNMDRSRSRESLNLQTCEKIYCNIINHFSHNLVASFLYLPSSFSFKDLRFIVKESVPFWQQNWRGEDVNFENLILIFANLFIVSIGVGAIWVHLRFVGLFPLYIFIIYILSNSLALTSGGRYVTPVDWIVSIYYISGLFKICSWLFRKMKPENWFYDNQSKMIDFQDDHTKWMSFARFTRIVTSIFILGCFLPALDSVIPMRYHERTSLDIITTLSQNDLLGDININNDLITEFLNDPNARLTYGRLLYPRFYPSNKGEPGLDFPYTALDYRRLVFLVIGPIGLIPEGVILPIENSKPGLHAADVAVLGCVNEGFLDALVVFILSEPKQVLIRPSGLTLQCPLPPP